jgi:hypothetical protein
VEDAVKDAADKERRTIGGAPVEDAVEDAADKERRCLINTSFYDVCDLNARA